MTLLVRQIEWHELAAFEAAGWECWPTPGLVTGGPVPKRATVTLYVPPDLTHQDLMEISRNPLMGLAALEAGECREDRE